MDNPQNYIENALNTSKTKQTFTFSKSKRFPKYTRLLTDATYNIPSTLETRTCGFGYGKKLSMINGRTISPPPGTYEFPYGIGSGKQKGIQFAIGREKARFGSFLDLAQSLSKYPSPERYHPVFQTLSKKSGVISKRLPTQIDIAIKKRTPGPGNYDLKATEMKNSGSYILSNFKNFTSPRFRSITDLSDKSKTKTSLAPLFYSTSEKEIGSYTVSKYKNVLGRTFSKAQRPGLEDKTKRGIPGSKYRRFSQFGGNNRC